MPMLAGVGVALGATAGTATATTVGALAVAGTAASVIGAGVSAYGMIQQGKAAKAEAYYNAAVADNAAISSGYAAIQESQMAQREADALRQQRMRLLGSNVAAASASGLTISGSVTDVMVDSAIESEKEIQMALYRGEMGAYNQRQRGAGLTADARMGRASGNNAYKSALWGAGGSLLSSGGGLASGIAKVRMSGSRKVGGWGYKPPKPYSGDAGMSSD